MARWNLCNVLQPGKEIRHLWQFSASGKFNLQRQETKLAKEKLPEKLISRDWQTLFQPRLDIAWLPADKVFLRVIQLPKADAAETQSMIDLQLEKVSPMPVAQIVWGYELLPTSEPDMQTAVVIIVPRTYVEEFLGSLETQGFMADRLELPFVDQLRATAFDGDGAWIYPAAGPDQSSCLVAWWYHGTMRNLSLVHLPSNGDRAAALQHQLAQMTWAGELEGWLTTPPKFRLVADSETAEEWSNFFGEDQSVEVIAPLKPAELAARTARRSVTGDVRTNLMPPGHSTRYRQQFIDRLWMRGLGAVLLFYVLIAGAYLAWVQVAKWRANTVEQRAVELGPTYTNVIQLRERVKVMQDQIDLQYAALECYRAVAETLPAELTLDSLAFDGRGRKLTLNGTGSADARTNIINFVDDIRRSTSKNQPLFTQVVGPQINAAQGGVRWSFICDLNRTEIE